ncbi:hypothetical protein BI336_02980 [Listeria monocytogenes]|nr:hypothetical protein [Listeria monocytogenes]EAD1187236.1 hypothetical protein [Listeria monocytogenes]EAD1457785.1 hypothetical protein [Listeria monocytogenes]EAE7092703.1 hypothetical protein [Listeria monocytogenes]EAF0570877.1 hypothetical protein [Listeria monocytogenes]
MKKYHFSKFNINVGSVTLLVMFSSFFSLSVILSILFSMTWEYYAILSALVIVCFFNFKKFFLGEVAVNEEAFYYRSKAYPYSKYIIECDAKLIRFRSPTARAMPYYRIVIINKDTRAEKLIKVHNAARRYKGADKQMQVKMEELRDQLKQYQS